jgi:hypothetical protein
MTSAVLILRNDKSLDWTDDLNTQMMNWTTNYIGRMTSSPIAYREWTAWSQHSRPINSAITCQCTLDELDGLGAILPHNLLKDKLKLKKRALRRRRNK